MARWATHRTDTGSKALIAYAESLGFVHVAIGGALDSLLAYGHLVTAVDWKSPGGTLTPSQQRIVAKGFPVRFISTPAQLDALKAELLK